MTHLPVNSQLGCWVQVCAEDDQELAGELAQQVDQRIAAGDYSEHNVKYIERLYLGPAAGTLRVSDATLESLRRLCQVWDVDVRLRTITSHRPVVGPVIVAIKRLLFPVLKVFLKDFIRQQRSFNAGVLALLAQLANQQANGFDESYDPEIRKS